MNLTLNNVFYKYPTSKKMVLNGINLDIKSNKVGLIGTSGSGKSTLVHLFNALHRPTHGEITIGEYKINNKSKLKNLQDVRKDVAIVYQFTDLQLFAETVKQELMFALRNFGIEKEDVDSEIEMYFEKFNLDLKYLKQSPFSLSGGQKKKVAIITMLLIDPKILILDEPTVGLDPQSLDDILEAISTMCDRGLKVIMISHDMNAVHSFCDHIVELTHGMKTFDGSMYDYFKHRYRQKKILLLPSEFSYGATVDTENVLYDRLFNGEGLENFLKEKNV